MRVRATQGGGRFVPPPMRAAEVVAAALVLLAVAASMDAAVVSRTEKGFDASQLRSSDGKLALPGMRGMKKAALPAFNRETLASWTTTQRQDFSASCASAMDSQCGVNLEFLDAIVPCTPCFESVGMDGEVSELLTCLEESGCCGNFDLGCYQSVAASNACTDMDRFILSLFNNALGYVGELCGSQDCAGAIDQQCGSYLIDGDFPCSDCLSQGGNDACLQGCCGDFATYLSCVFTASEETCENEAPNIILYSLLLNAAGGLAAQCTDYAISPQCQNALEDACASPMDQDLETCLQSESAQACCGRQVESYFCVGETALSTPACAGSFALLIYALRAHSDAVEDVNALCENALGEDGWESLQAERCATQIADTCDIDLDDLDSFPCYGCQDLNDPAACYEQCCGSFLPNAECTLRAFQSCTPGGIAAVSLSQGEFFSFITGTQVACSVNGGPTPTTPPIPTPTSSSVPMPGTGLDPQTQTAYENTVVLMQSANWRSRTAIEDFYAAVGGSRQLVAERDISLMADTAMERAVDMNPESCQAAIEEFGAFANFLNNRFRRFKSRVNELISASRRVEYVPTDEQDEPVVMRESFTGLSEGQTVTRLLGPVAMQTYQDKLVLIQSANWRSRTAIEDFERFIGARRELAGVDDNEEHMSAFLRSLDAPEDCLEAVQHFNRFFNFLNNRFRRFKNVVNVWVENGNN